MVLYSTGRNNPGFFFLVLFIKASACEPGGQNLSAAEVGRPLRSMKRMEEDKGGRNGRLLKGISFYPPL